jgi:hypothetical protein
MISLKKRVAGSLALTMFTAFALISVIGPSVAEAGTSTSTFTVSAVVNSPCTLTTSNLTFPAYSSGGSGTKASANFVVNCPGVTAGNPDIVNLTFSTASGQFAMTNGTVPDRLTYMLCDGAACNSAYSPGTHGPWFGVTTSPQTYSVYGFIDDNQNVAGGGLLYQQTVTATLTF